METTVQEKFDALIKEHGAEEVIKAIKGHTIQPRSGGDCKTTGCAPHYVCSPSGNCQLDVGG